MCGVKGRNNQLDIDVMIRNQNQIGIIEAKTNNQAESSSQKKSGSKAKSLEGVKQLSLAMRYLKGTYIRQFLVLNCEPSPDQTMMCDHDLLNIPIIALTHYRLGMHSLQQDDIDTLLAGVDKVMRTEVSRS